MSGKLSSKEIRKRIGHPVIDADGHWLEFGPSINDYLKEVAGQKVGRFVSPPRRLRARSRSP